MNFNIFQIRGNLQTVLIAHNVEIVQSLQVHSGKFFDTSVNAQHSIWNRPLGDLDDINMFGSSAGELGDNLNTVYWNNPFSWLLDIIYSSSGRDLFNMCTQARL